MKFSYEGLVVGTLAIFSVSGSIVIICRSDWYKAKREQLISRYLESTGLQSSTAPDVMRSTFNKVPIIPKKPVKGHSHPVSAAERTTASNFIERISEDLGLEPYFVQCSAADQRLGRAGSRAHYWVKDLTVGATPFETNPGNAIVLIDVDYYLDMHDLLVREFKPTFIYAFQPTAVARSTDEYSFTFDLFNNVRYQHSGGGSYRHPVWNYSVDHITVWRLSPILGVLELATFLVDKRRLGPDHEVICLTPLMKWRGLPALVALRRLSGNILDVLRVSHGEFTRMYVQRNDGLYMSTGRVDLYAECTIPAAHDEALAVVGRVNGTKMALPTVLSYIPEGELAERKAQASVLLLYHRMNCPYPHPPTVFPIEESVRNFDFGVEDYDPTAKRTLTPFMNPLMHGAFAPVASVGNELACIQGRITGFTKHAKTIKMTEFLDRTMREFAKLLLPVAHMLHPVDLDEVYEKQNRPSQRRILDQSMIEEPNRLIKMFTKKEAYGDLKEPRPISQINGADKRDYSMYIYAVADVIKTTEWYAFGITPAVIAERVSELLSQADMAVNTDFSRFDGRVSPVLRELERIVLVRAFDQCYVREITNLHGSQFNQPAVGTFGSKYNTGTARASGSPETAAFNSLANAYVAYLTFRSTRTGGAYMQPQEAWERLGLYGGDDGLTANVDPVTYQRCATLVGMKLDVEEVVRGDMGIKFLARIYGPDVWYGDSNSCCDLPRQLTKFHTTVSLPPNITPTDKLLEKVRAFALTDANTPILGDFIRRVLDHSGAISMSDKTLGMRIWNSDLPIECQYPNVDHGWMTAYAESALADYGFDSVLFMDWLETRRTLDEMLSPPLFAEPKAPTTKVAVVVDGDILEPPKPKQQPKSDNHGSKRARSGPSKGRKVSEPPSPRKGRSKTRASPPASGRR